MDEIRTLVRTLQLALTPEGILDILVVWFVVYQCFVLLKGSRTHHLRGLGLGLLFVAAAWMVTRPERGLLRLDTFNWLLTQAAPYGLIALVVVFQPEIRQSFSQLGQVSLFGRPAAGSRAVVVHSVNEVVDAVEAMVERRIGALIVFERRDPLNEIVETGKLLDAEVSAELLTTLFHPAVLLHDGAVVLRADRVVAAACLLPLTERRDLSSVLGTRHRAAIGLAERCDAVTVVVSEESGVVSLAYAGELHRGLGGEDLKGRLLDLLQPAGSRLLKASEEAEVAP
jgi:diadenylate cyclase